MGVGGNRQSSAARTASMTTSGHTARRAARSSTAAGAQSAGLVSELREVPLDQIEVPPRPARRFLGDVAALAESMQDYGLQQPISVRADRDRFILTSGLRRLTAARMLRWETITAFVRSVDADQAYLLDLIENLQREDLRPEEEADALGELIRTRGWTLQQVADGIKRSVAYVSKRIRVFEDPVLRQAIVDRGLPVSTAEELLAADPEKRAALIERAVVERWDQTRARQELQWMNRPQPTPEEVAQRAAEIADTAYGVGQLALPGGRPRGFTRAVREFHELISSVESSDLNEADRAALRALYRDLTMLARAAPTRQPRVFPPLPDAPTSSRAPQRRARSTRGHN